VYWNKPDGKPQLDKTNCKHHPWVVLRVEGHFLILVPRSASTDDERRSVFIRSPEYAPCLDKEGCWLPTNFRPRATIDVDRMDRRKCLNFRLPTPERMKILNAYRESRGEGKEL
jgi:hypothetical protein